MKRATITAAAFAAALGGCGKAEPPEAASQQDGVAVWCGNVIDGLADTAQGARTIRIVDGRIASVTEGRPEGDGFIDLGDMTCLPGFIDTHTHITDQAEESRDLTIYYRRTLDETVEISKRNAAVTLAAGFTTVRNVGAYYGWAGREVRDRINAGEFPGPRMQTAGYYLTIPGGGGDLVIPGYPEEDIPAFIRLGVARGADNFRRKAQAAVDGGADVLKVIASGAVLAYGGIPGAPEMTPDELRAVAEVAHAAGIKMTAHAHGAQSIKEAILAGADSIEHASLADDEAIALAAERGVAFSMDIYNGTHIATVGQAQGWPEEFLRKNEETMDVQREVFRKAHAAGVPIIYGTDAAVYPHGENAKQFAVMVEHGMTPMEAIRSATSVAARFIGWEADVGAIEAGRYGDIVGVRGDPLADIRVLEHVDAVVKGGQRYQ